MRKDWKRASETLKFTKEDLSALVSEAFPQSEVISFEESPGGLANTNIRLQVSGGSKAESKAVLIRFFVRDPKQAAKEWCINKLLQESVPMPEFYYYSKSNPISGHPFILMEYLEAQRMEEVILDLDQESANKLGRSLGSALASIHSFKFAEAGFFDPELLPEELKVSNKIETGANGLLTYANQCLIENQAGKRIGDELSKRLLKFLQSEAGLLDEWQEDPSLTHADFGASNLLVEKVNGILKLAAVLDWEFAFSGVKLMDFGNLLRAPFGSIAGFTDALAEGYLKAGGRLPDRWRQMSLLIDLTAWLEFMCRPEPGENLINDAKRVIEATMENWQRGRRQVQE